MIIRDEYNQQLMLEVERKIIEDVQRVKANLDSYGDEVEVVAKRVVISEDGGYEYEYKLSDDRVVSNDYAWEMAQAGRLRHIIGSHNKGKKHIKSVGDGRAENNLGSIPRFF